MTNARHFTLHFMTIGIFNYLGLFLERKRIYIKNIDIENLL